MIAVALYSIYLRDLVSCIGDLWEPWLTWTSLGKSVDTTRKSAIKLVKLPSLRVISLKRGNIWLRKFATIYRSLYDEGQMCRLWEFTRVSAHKFCLWNPEFSSKQPVNTGSLLWDPFPSLSSRFFHPFPKQRACSQAKLYDFSTPYPSTNACNPESRFHWRRIQSPSAWNPESKTASDYLQRGESLKQYGKINSLSFLALMYSTSEQYLSYSVWSQTQQASF